MTIMSVVCRNNNNNQPQDALLKMEIKFLTLMCC